MYFPTSWATNWKQRNAGQLCNACTCPCGSEVEIGSSDLDKLPKIRVSGINVTIHHCCARGQDLITWALACATSRFKPLATEWVLSSTGETDSSTNAAGVGYGCISASKQKYAQPVKSLPIFKNQEKEIKTLELRFRLVAALLPSLANDASQVGLFAFMLARSDLLIHAGNLLGNDCLEDIKKQYQLCDGVLDFIEALASHPTLASLVTQDRQIFDSRGRLDQLSFAPYMKVDSKVNALSTGKSLSSMLATILPQSEAMLQYAKSYQLGDAEMQSWNSRLVRIAQLYCDKAVPVKKSLLPTPAAPTQSFVDYHRENRVAEIPDSEALLTFFYKGEAEKAATQVPPRHRMKRMVRELAILQTSLPEGIFVRHGSSRPDVLKVLIIGPQDTPYADGFFLFDMFLPVEFPQQAPLVRFCVLPQSAAHVGFNPNLYSNGYVCLSLLGTWSGEPWRPEQSTLLQVLVSIQSMIFCANPWYNEPGREKDNARSKSYNEMVRQMTLEDAICPWIKTMATPNSATKEKETTAIPNFDPLWKDVAVTYFGKDSKYGKKLR
ncbi:uncharacterized protein PG998_005283 [Apiospora kogelbergensis]|uniref:uncharacterized protein n=1 Tax=Apiospora kogelbergensis TaxID=1337665 RepID=UPI00312EEFA6